MPQRVPETKRAETPARLTKSPTAQDALINVRLLGLPETARLPPLVARGAYVGLVTKPP